MSPELSHAQQKLGPAPREVPEALKAALRRPPPPRWMPRSDGLRRLWAEHDRLVSNGEVTWGHIYMANSDLYAEGPADAPAGMLHSFDPFILRNPEILESLGTRLFERYEANGRRPLKWPHGPWFAMTHAYTIDDTARVFGFVLPPTLTWGHVVFMSTPMIHRDHMPGGILSDNLLPILAARDPKITGTTLVLPDALRREGLKGFE
ncbi:MAG: hypothetical protein AAF449_16685 [Myxococcota bacterium]